MFPAISAIRRTLLVLAAFGLNVALTSFARAADYTDIWWVTGGVESGWGVNFVQNEDVVFATFYVYDANGKPFWVSSPMFRTPAGTYVGDLNYSTGSFFGGPWGGASATKVGSATFTPTSAMTGILTYSVSGVPGIPSSLITKNIERADFRTIVLGGSYVGGQSGAYTSCADSSNNFNYIDRYDLTVTHDTVGGFITFSFQYTNGLACVLSGALQQQGQLYAVPSASYTCSDGLNTSASMSEIKATSLGIEGRLIAPTVAGGCREDGTFAAVLE